MQFLFAYLLKLAFCLALGYLFYLLLLRRMTYYTWNRYYLLLFPLVALAIPALPVALPQKVQGFNINYFITDALPAVATVENNSVQRGIQWDPISIAIMIMLAGMLFFLCRFAMRLYSVYRIRSASRMVHNGDIKIYHLTGFTAPFSFYNSIYLDTDNYDQTELDKIIEHELVHVTQKHTLDMLVSEWLCIVQWFNPFVWMMKHAIKQNLEFIADDCVLQKGINRKKYQYLLLKVSGAASYPTVNNLLFPSLKKRIQMMNKTKTGKVHLLKFMCLVPFACLLLLAFSGPVGKPPSFKNNTDAFSLSNLSFFTNDAYVAQLVQKDQSNSLLKEGGEISLSLISEEKQRLKILLEKNGYDTSGGRAIRFVMDTSISRKSFSVKVVIELPKSKLKNLPAETDHMDTLSIAKDRTVVVYIPPGLSKKIGNMPPGNAFYAVTKKRGIDKFVMHPESGK
jgi:beta-lactamase regulating signal transducer with metallopeptidase domain